MYIHSCFIKSFIKRKYYVGARTFYFILLSRVKTTYHSLLFEDWRDLLLD